MTGELCSQPPLGVAEIMLPEAVGDVEVDGVAARRLAGARRDGRLDDARQPTEAGRVFAGRVLATSAAPLVVVGRARAASRAARRVAVERVAVGEGELRALGDDVDELGRRRARRGRSPRGARAAAGRPDRAPRHGLADREAAVLERGDRLERRAPAAMSSPVRSPLLGCDEAIDLLGDEALVVRAPRPLDLLLARTAAGLRRGCAGRWRRAPGCGTARPTGGARQVEVARAGPRARAAPRCGRSSRGFPPTSGKPFSA